MIKSLALAALVTAAVTFPGEGTVVAQAQPAATYSVVITNNQNGEKVVYVHKTWPGQGQCDAAILGIQEQLSSVEKMAPVPPAEEADPDLLTSIHGLVAVMWERTHKLPSLGISCEALGSPS